MRKYKCENYILEYSRITCYGIQGVSIDKFYLTKDTKNITLPNEIDGFDVVYLKSSVFRNSDFSSIVLPNSLIGIGANAFESNKSLKEITFPKTLKEVGPAAFRYCSLLENINFNEGLETISSNAFRQTNVKNLNFPDSLLCISSYAFSASPIENIHFGKQLESLGSYSFASCNIKSVTLPESLYSLYSGAFENCKLLESIYLGENLGDINTHEEFLYGCDKLKQVDVSPKNKYFKSIDGVLYDRDDNTIIRVPPALNVRSITVPSWVKRASPGCFSHILAKRVIFETENVLGIEKTGISPLVRVCCNKDSAIEKVLKEMHHENISYSISEIDKFVNSISDEVKIDK